MKYSCMLPKSFQSSTDSTPGMQCMCWCLALLATIMVNIVSQRLPKGFAILEFIFSLIFNFFFTEKEQWFKFILDCMILLMVVSYVQNKLIQKKSQRSQLTACRIRLVMKMPFHKDQAQWVKMLRASMVDHQVLEEWSRLIIVKYLQMPW